MPNCIPVGSVEFVLNYLKKHYGVEGVKPINIPHKDIIVKSTLDGAKNKTKIVVLMHDAAAKTTTVEALPEIINGLIQQGFKFESLNKDSYAPHF